MMARKMFEVGKIYREGGILHKENIRYIVVKRNDETDRVTIQEVDGYGNPFGDKMSRKINIWAGMSPLDKYEAIKVSVHGRFCTAYGVVE